jgi:catechol-2,3-dioxygenase
MEIPMPQIAELGHVGLFVNDLERSRKFYTEVLGLHVSDEDLNLGVIFLSSRPDEEHHELVLCAGRDAPPGTKLVQQVSFRCPTLEDVLDYYERFVAAEVTIQMAITHGNAIGVYFEDPDGNIAEVYWATKIAAPQPFLEHLDFTQSPDQLMQQVRELVDAAAGASDTLKAEVARQGVAGSRPGS